MASTGLEGMRVYTITLISVILKDRNWSIGDGWWIYMGFTNNNTN